VWTTSDTTGHLLSSAMLSPFIAEFGGHSMRCATHAGARSLRSPARSASGDAAGGAQAPEDQLPLHRSRSRRPPAAAGTARDRSRNRCRARATGATDQVMMVVADPRFETRGPPGGSIRRTRPAALSAPSTSYTAWVETVPAAREPTRQAPRRSDVPPGGPRRAQPDAAPSPAGPPASGRQDPASRRRRAGHGRYPSTRFETVQ